MLIGECNGLGVNRTAPSKECNELVLSDQFIGVEIELEGCDPNYGYPDKFFKYWSKHADHSLRNRGNKVAIEYVFNGGLHGKQVVDALNIFESEMNKMQPTVSWRCGLHVHMDVSAMTVDELLKFIFIYMMYEKAIFKYVGQKREESPFCVPLTSNSLSYDRLVRYIEYLNDGKPAATFQMFFNEWHKYNAMNLAPIVRFGTVEFRQACADYKAENILNWINILLSIKASVNHIKLNDFREFHKIISQFGLEGFSARVFGKYLGALLYPEFYSDCIMNLRTVQSLVLNLNKGDIVKAAIDKCPKLGLRSIMEDKI